MWQYIAVEKQFSGTNREKLFVIGKFLLILLYTFWMCASHDRTSSKWTPKVLVVETLGITVSSMSILILESIFKSFFLLATSMEQHFGKLSTISFCLHQSKDFPVSIRKFDSTSFTSLHIVVKVKSSAYITSSVFDKNKGMSLIYNIKNNGPRIDPWGTPDIIFIHIDNDFCIHTFCDLDSRYEVNHCMLSTLHLYSLSFCIKIVWWDVCSWFRPTSMLNIHSNWL